ncbi:Outer membrane protein (OmpH-like) [Anatilimnocola aggregata]|uniref:Outer membrane protein (OmpH-like) n=1 Tax=Anatilimnocola aggregata TaxID=2528021 RepID=A0A517YMI3_9BACT|nr:OmpH family outer membrane protein [Anatilimnocola aggregata]QDU31435.1 Outer membrane protein (OmpH-like) [Anatilimnocola aggregata]
MAGNSAFSRYGWALTLLAIFALWLRVEGMQWPATANAAPEASKTNGGAAVATVGVVDVWQAFEGHKKYIDYEVAGRKRAEEFARNREGIFAEYERLHRSYKELSEDSDEAVRLKRQLERMYVDMTDSDEKLKREESRNWNRLKADCYEDLLRAVDLVKKEKQLTLVLSAFEYNFDPNKSSDVFYRQYRAVVRYDESLDITKDVIAYLNKETL